MLHLGAFGCALAQDRRAQTIKFCFCKNNKRIIIMGGTEKQKKGMENAIKRDLQLADVGTAPRGFPQLQSMGAIIHGEA
jgi:hypothetical protein